MHKNTIEKVNIGLSIGAFIVSAAAFLFSYYTYKQGQEEKLSFLQKPTIENYPTKAYSIGNKIVVPIFWDLTISNNSAKNISIIDMEAECKTSNGIVMYSNMFNGLYTDIDTKTDLPINLNSGESKRFMVSLGILCDSNASSIIKQKIISFNDYDTISGTWTRLNVLKKILSESGIDFYDNKTHGNFNGENILTYEVKPDKQQIFEVKFTTSSKDIFSSKFCLYNKE